VTTQTSSVYQKLRSKELSLDEALSSIVSTQGELNAQGLDHKLISSVNKNWPLDIALPLFLHDKTLYVACNEIVDYETREGLRKYLNRFELETLDIQENNWEEVLTNVLKIPLTHEVYKNRPASSKATVDTGITTNHSDISVHEGSAYKANLNGNILLSERPDGTDASASSGLDNNSMAGFNGADNAGAGAGVNASSNHADNSSESAITSNNAGTTSSMHPGANTSTDPAASTSGSITADFNNNFKKDAAGANNGFKQAGASGGQHPALNEGASSVAGSPVASLNNSNPQAANPTQTNINGARLKDGALAQQEAQNSKIKKDSNAPKTAQLGAHLLETIKRIEQRRISSIDDNSIATEVRNLIAISAKQGASDIHYEPTENSLIVRFRIDGVLKDICKYVCTPDADYRKILLARIKIIANLNIAEARIPQDGRVTEIIDGKKIDLRVSTLPCLHGEKCVIRLLPHENKFLELSDLGMPDDLIPSFESWLNMSQGMILITGPTGSGKTSTLYTSLAKVIDVTKNVVTVEDPVEFQLARVNQVQVNSKAGLTFSAGLRSILRQDPDIVMLGEIRDRETAEIAIQAALTGHLVLSTLHTNDAPSSINRLIDMGVEPYLVASALVGVMAQRLLRVACHHCKQEYTATPTELLQLGLDPNSNNVRLVKAVGCEKCNHSGYAGREGIFEIMHVNNKIKNMAHNKADLEEIKAVMAEHNMTNLFEAGVTKILNKESTMEEFIRVIPREQ
jgi:type II secretory ATPase GspE/PulE/Tfp pilus assembly ATPase PilB-like protein